MTDLPDTPATSDTPEYIELQQFLKLSGLVDSGGQAKHLIQEGEVKVNGVTETRRRRKLYVGDTIEVFDQFMEVSNDEEDEE